MKRSTQKILTSHAGGLPRTKEVLELLYAREDGQPIDTGRLDAAVRRGVSEVVQQQAEAGVTVPNDGEMSKVSYGSYVKDRLNGLGGEVISTTVGRDAKEFPEWAARSGNPQNRRPTCNGPLSWKDFAAVEKDIDALKAAIKGRRFEEVFMSSASPGIITFFLENRYYKTEEDYLYAVADVMKREYEAIVKAGFVLHLDVPEVALGANSRFAELPLREFRKVMGQHVEAMNYATKSIPPEQMRIHVCWGRSEAPHNHDVELKNMVDLILKARPAGISIMACNPRHGHEWKVWKDNFSEGKVLIPGVIDATNNFIEHPELVAERVVRFAGVVGRENVIGGTDCGLGSPARRDNPLVDPRVAWAKLKTLSEGAALATKDLWARSSKPKQSAAASTKARTTVSSVKKTARPGSGVRARARKVATRK